MKKKKKNIVEAHYNLYNILFLCVRWMCYHCQGTRRMGILLCAHIIIIISETTTWRRKKQPDEVNGNGSGYKNKARRRKKNNKRTAKDLTHIHRSWLGSHNQQPRSQSLRKLMAYIFCHKHLRHSLTISRVFFFFFFFFFFFVLPRFWKVHKA